MSESDDARWISGEDWQAATNPDLPEGVIEMEDSDGLRWHYPLIEFQETP